jgi:restriction endonuclease S subunit
VAKDTIHSAPIIVLWSSNGLTSGEFFFNLKYLENIYFQTIKVLRVVNGFFTNLVV